MGFSFRYTGCVKHAKECWNESHIINGSPRPSKTKEKRGGVNGATAMARTGNCKTTARQGTTGICRRFQPETRLCTNCNVNLLHIPRQS